MTSSLNDSPNCGYRCRAVAAAAGIDSLFAAGDHVTRHVGCCAIERVLGCCLSHQPSFQTELQVVMTHYDVIR